MNSLENKSIQDRTFEKNHPHNEDNIVKDVPTGSPIRYALFAGVLMSIFALLSQAIFTANFSWIHYLQYIILAYFAFQAVIVSNRNHRDGTFFQRGLSRGAVFSVVAGVVIVLFNLLISAVAPDFSLARFGEEVSETTPIMVSSFGILMEVFVFGLILTFIFLQYEKRSSSSRPIPAGKEESEVK